MLGQHCQGRGQLGQGLDGRRDSSRHGVLLLGRRSLSELLEALQDVGQRFAAATETHADALQTLGESIGQPRLLRRRISVEPDVHGSIVELKIATTALITIRQKVVIVTLKDFMFISTPD